MHSLDSIGNSDTNKILKYHDPYLREHIPEKSRDDTTRYVNVYPRLNDSIGKGKRQLAYKVIKLEDYDLDMKNSGIKHGSIDYLIQLRMSSKTDTVFPFFKIVIFCGNCLYSWKQYKGITSLPTTKCQNCGDIIIWNTRG